jgi:hypothetical protein
MIEHTVFYGRLENFCKRCPHWKNVCLKGHGLSSEEGCPVKKFLPVAGAGYAVDRQAEASAPATVRGCEGCGNQGMPPMTWGQVLASFTKSMAEWIRVGVPLVSSRIHGLRYDQCKNCTEFHRFYCNRCKCVCFLKSKLATEQCPLPEPRWISTIDLGG